MGGGLDRICAGTCIDVVEIGYNYREILGKRKYVLSLDIVFTLCLD